jgi:hypothetical protein
LRRLERHLEDRILLEEEPPLGTKLNVKAVGVLGTEVYDKLLVLRALRKRFPGACFFTTDLDARFFAPSEREFTQNLVVASHFPLELHADLQRAVAPFRDSYQTAAFLATLLAVGDPLISERGKHFSKALCSEGSSRPGEFPWPLPFDVDPKSAIDLSPLVFEVGRGDAYQLTLTGEFGDPPRATAAVFPASPRERPWFFEALWRVPALLLMVAFGVFCAAVTVPGVGRWLYPVRWAAFAVVLVVGLFLLVYVYCVWHGVTAVGVVISISVPIISWLILVARWGPLRFRALPDSVWKTALVVVAGLVVWGLLRRDPGFRVWAALILAVLPYIAVMLSFTSVRERLYPPRLGPLVLCFAIAVLLLALPIRENHHNPDGEPFSWWDGISIWPSCLIRLVGLILSILLISRVWHMLAEDRGDLLKRYVQGFRGASQQGGAKAHERGALPCPWLQVTKWMRSVKPNLVVFGREDPPKKLDGASLLAGYCESGKPVFRLCRALIGALAFCVVAALLLRIFGEHQSALARGDIAPWLPRSVLVLGGFSALVLTFLCLDAVQLCCRFMHALAKDWDKPEDREAEKPRTGVAKCEDPRTRPWPAHSVRELYHGEEGAKGEGAEPRKPPGHVECERLHVRVIANCSDEVRRIALYPLLVFFVMLSARLPVFGKAGFTWLRAALAVAVVVAVVASACALRYAAGIARQRILVRLQDGLARASSCKQKQKRELGMERYRQAIQETKEERRGAFLPLIQDPHFQILAVPFGGIGGLVLLEELVRWF